MKKLVLLSLSAVAALGISMNAADLNRPQAAMATDVTHAAEIKVSDTTTDPFAGIALSADQKEKLDRVLTAVRNSTPDNEEQQKELSRKAMYQMKKILTADQYVKYLENIATSQKYLPGF